MVLIKNILLVLHVITAAAWFGLGLRLAAQARLAVGSDGAVGAAFLAYLGGTVRLMGIFIVLTFVLGVGVFVSGGGMGAYGPTYHTAMTLVLVLVVLHFALIQPILKKMGGVLAAGGDAQALQKRITMAAGIGHLLWLVTLVLMFWPRISAALQAG